jgi:chromosome segregation ATPase
LVDAMVYYLLSSIDYPDLPMPRFLPIIVVLLLAAVASAAPGSSEQIEQAKRDLRRAEDRVEAARQRLRNAEARLDERRRLRSLIIADLDRLPLDVDAMRRRLPDVEATIAAARQESTDATNVVRDAAQRARDAAAVVANLEQGVAEARRIATESLAKSDDAIATHQRVSEAAKRLETATNDVLARLANDAAYLDLTGKATELKQQVEALRASSTADPNILSARSQAWMSAQSAAGAYQGKAVDNDDAVKSARAQQSAAVQALQALERDHAARVEQDPEVVRRGQDLKQANAALQTATAEVNRAESSLATIKRRIDEISAEAAQMRSVIASLQSRVDQLTRDLRGQDELVRLAEVEWLRARDALRAAERQRQAAAARLAELVRQ